MQNLEINPKEVKEKLIYFLRSNAQKIGIDKAVLGLSGGLDSATVAYLCSDALGADNVSGVIMPYKTTPEPDIKDAKRIAGLLGIKTKCIEITAMVDVYFKNMGSADKMRRGNKMARERMSILFDQSKELNAMVVGTSNKTERLLGYGTIYGDLACAINPLGNLYKTQVIQLAHFLRVPLAIINKAPSAGLWVGQTDEKELGFKYRDVDELLYYLVDKKYTQSRLTKKGFAKEFIDKVEARIKRNRFKGQLPKIARI